MIRVVCAIILLYFLISCLSNCCYTCRIFEKDGVKLVVDDISYDFVKGATVDYEEELIRSAFVVSFQSQLFIS